MKYPKIHLYIVIILIAFSENVSAQLQEYYPDPNPAIQKKLEDWQDLKFPCRWWATDPGEVNRANWSSALQEEGFTALAQDAPTLNKERIWYDKNAPVFGEGN